MLQPYSGRQDSLPGGCEPSCCCIKPVPWAESRAASLTGRYFLPGSVPSLALHSTGQEVAPLQFFPPEGYMCRQNERIIKGTWQWQSHLHVKGAISGREAHFGEETCLSALPNSSTLVLLKSFLTIPAGKQKQHPTSYPQNLTVKITFFFFFKK